MSKYRYFDLTPEVIGAMIIAAKERTSLFQVEWITARPFTHLMVLSRLQVSALELEAAALVYSLDSDGALPLLHDSEVGRKVRAPVRQLSRFNLEVTGNQAWRTEQEKRIDYLRQQWNDEVMSFLMALWVTELLEFVWLRHKDWDYCLHQPDIHWLYFTENLFDLYNMKYRLGADERPPLDEWKRLVRDILSLHLR